MKLAIILISTVTVIFFVFLIPRKATSELEETEFEMQGRKLTVEIAATAQKRATGLMYRENLDQNKGMLFIFPDEAKHSFWMANTKIPLDIIWMDKDYNVVHVEQDVPPCTDKTLMTCPSYTPNLPAKYVLEVNAGWWNEP